MTNELVEAIQSQQVMARRGTTRADGPTSRAVHACEAIGRRMGEETDRVAELLESQGIRVVDRRDAAPRQRHFTQVRVSSRREARAAADVLTAEGWRHLREWGGGAARSFWNNCPQVPLLRTGDATITLDIGFEPDRSTNPVVRSLRPAAPDWYAVDLPPAAWWAYWAIRPLRVAARRAGVPVPVVPAPFFSTPDCLIDPLLSAAGVGRDDVVVDLGCGDGRLVTAAAERRGCTAIGVEALPDRVAMARLRAAGSSAAERIEIRQGDAFDCPLDEATVLLMFLPLADVADALPALLGRLRPGARVLVHEQSPLPADLRPRPQLSLPVVASEALTVAHLWRVD